MVNPPPPVCCGLEPNRCFVLRLVSQVYPQESALNPNPNHYSKPPIKAYPKKPQFSQQTELSEGVFLPYLWVERLVRGKMNHLNHLNSLVYHAFCG